MSHEQLSVQCILTNRGKSSFLTWLILTKGKKSLAVDCFHKIQFHFIMCVLRGLVLLWKGEARGNVMILSSTNVMKN